MRRPRSARPWQRSNNQGMLPSMPTSDDGTTGLVTSPDDEVVRGADCPEHAWADAIIYTIGHSTRSQADFIDLLQRYGIATLVDVRTIPRSRHNPQFAMEELTAALPKVGIAYVHLAQLGGRRHGLGSTSPNKGWRNAGFRGYADHMLTPEFTVGMDKLHVLTKAGPAAVMCAEAVPWRCHRSLIADALLVRGVETEDIQSLTRTRPHALTPFAHVEGVQITYPEISPPVEEDARYDSR